MESITRKTKSKTNNCSDVDDKDNRKISRSVNSCGGCSNRFLSCCRPMDATPMEHDGCTDDSGCKKPVFKYIAMAEEEGVLFPQILPGLTEDRDNMKKKKKKKDGHHRSLKRIIKAVLFETSLAKKIRKRKLQQKMYQQDNDPLVKPEEFLKPTNKNSVNQIFSMETNQRILPKSSSSTSESSNDQRRDNLQDHGKGCYSDNIGLCLILISLLILMLWGKICAILWTSTWLFFNMTRLSNRYNSNSSPDEVSTFEINPENNKKMIVVEEILKWNR